MKINSKVLARYERIVANLREESASQTPRQRKIAQLKAEIRQEKIAAAKKLKEKKTTSTAAEKLKGKRQMPKGVKKTTPMEQPAGYPLKGDQKASLAKGKGKSTNPRITKEKALSDSNKKLVNNPKLKSTPKPNVKGKVRSKAAPEVKTPPKAKAKTTKSANFNKQVLASLRANLISR